MKSLNAIGHFVNGEEVFKGKILERFNPADNTNRVAEYYDGTTGVLNAAINAARDAFPGWAKLTRRDRAEVIARAAAKLDTAAWRTKFRDAMIGEIGKTTAGANGEVEKTVRILRHMAGFGTHASDKTIHADQSNVHMYTQTEPVGVAGLITPFNFPLAVPAWKIAPALVAGCAVVVKPSPAAPMTSSLLMQLLDEAMKETPAVQKAGVGPGVINLIHGEPKIVQQLVEHPDVSAVSFTGSTHAGKDILRWAMNREPALDPRHFVAEMGGQNALVVLRDADIEEAVKAAINGAFFGEGQRCTATSRFVVDEPVYDEFMKRLVERTRELKIGPGDNPQNEIGPLVSDQALQNVISQIGQCVLKGMKLIYGGHRIYGSSLREHDLKQGNFIEPTILKGDPFNPEHLALREEIFGPVAGVCKVYGLDEALDVVNKTVKHRHAASVFTRDLAQAFRFAKEAHVGMVHVNNPTIGGDVQAPFGGLGGDTSFGPREMGPDAMLPFTVDKTVDINYGGASLERGAR